MTSALQAFLDASAELTADFEWWTDAVHDVDGAMAQDGGHDWGHIWRVLKGARAIVDAEGRGDWEVVAAAVLYHDVVNVPKSSPDRHLASTESADVAVDRLAPHFGDERLARIHEAIRCHSYSAGLTPESFEAQAVSDADKFEALGALGLARTFYVSGHMGGTIVHPFDPFGTDRDLDDVAYAVDHFFRKLLKLEERFYTAHGKAVAAERTQVLRDFLEQLEREL
jgi:uncharacterized protein